MVHGSWVQGLGVMGFETASGRQQRTRKGLLQKDIVLLSVNRIWLWVYYNEIRIYPIFYLPEGDYTFRVRRDVKKREGGDPVSRFDTHNF